MTSNTCKCGREKGKKLTRCSLCQEKYNKAYREGTSPQGLLGRMKRLLSVARNNAQRQGFAAPNISAELLLIAWREQKGLCAWTGAPITLLNCVLDHNHITGEFRGFVTSRANFAEGHLSKMSFEERVNFFNKLYSEEISHR